MEEGKNGRNTFRTGAKIYFSEKSILALGAFNFILSLFCLIAPMVNPDACVVFYTLKFPNNKSNVAFRMDRNCNYENRCNATKNQGKYLVTRLLEPGTLQTH